MATQDTVDFGEPHPPKVESVKLFKEIVHALKKELIHIRHQHDKHEPEYFAAAKDISDAELAGFTVDNLEQVRVGTSAYGYHIFGKVRIPALPDSGPAYVHFRAFDSGPDSEAKLHSIHTEDKQDPSGDHRYRAIFTKHDPLEWFST